MSGFVAMAELSTLDDLDVVAYRTPVIFGLSATGYVHMVGGPTGYESAPLAGLAEDAAAGRGWYACAGTEKRWRRCFVPPDQLAAVVEGLS